MAGLRTDGGSVRSFVFDGAAAGGTRPFSLLSTIAAPPGLTEPANLRSTCLSSSPSISANFLLFPINMVASPPFGNPSYGFDRSKILWGLSFLPPDVAVAERSCV